MSVSCTLSGSKLTFVVDGVPYTINRGHRNYNSVAKAIKDGKSETEVLAEYNTAFSVQNYLSGQNRVTYKDGAVYLDGQVLHNTIVDRVALFAEAGLPIEPLLRFIGNLENNPSMTSREELYAFLEHSDIVLSDDGCFLAYKAVRGDYYDKYSGTFLNTVGSKHAMERRNVDDNSNRTCSKGFHVGSILYAGPGGFYHSSGDRVMLVKVNPADAVSVPADHNAQKLRVCAYEVVGEVTGKLEAPLYSSAGDSYNYTPVDYQDVEFEGFDDFDDEYDYEDSEIYESDYDEEDLEMPPEITL